MENTDTDKTMVVKRIVGMEVQVSSRGSEQNGGQVPWMPSPETPIPIHSQQAEQIEAQYEETPLLKTSMPDPNWQTKETSVSDAETLVMKTPMSSTLPKVVPPAETPKVTRVEPVSKRLVDVAKAKALQERCRQLCLSLFLRDRTPVQSLGFTSSITGEGKSFLAVIMANVLAGDASEPVVLLECNWEHPCFHEYFGIAPEPGLAEWLRGECSESAIRHEVGSNLTVIPAGNGKQDAVRLLQQIRQRGLPDVFARSKELLIVDLPPVATCAYGSLAASLVESLIIVIRSGVTTEPMLAEANAQLKDLPVYGAILNQVESRIPRWIRQLL